MTPSGDDTQYPLLARAARAHCRWHRTATCGSTTDSQLVKIRLVPDPSGEFTSLTPARILDTRDGTGRSGVTDPLGDNSSFDVQITGRGGVPSSSSDVVAVVLNATVTEPGAGSYLTVSPAGVARPLISNLNYEPGQTVPNLVTVGLGNGGKVSVYNRNGPVHVIFDVVGYYSTGAGPDGSRFHGLTPFRYFDTRDGTGGVPATKVGQAGTLKFKVTGKGGVPASGVTAVVMNVTITEPSLSSFLTVYPDDVLRPVASNLNYVPGLTVPNLVTVRVPASGIVDFYNHLGATHVLADVVGYYDDVEVTEAGRLIPLVPTDLRQPRVEPIPAAGKITAGQRVVLPIPRVPRAAAHRRHREHGHQRHRDRARHREFHHRVPSATGRYHSHRTSTSSPSRPYPISSSSRCRPDCADAGAAKPQDGSSTSTASATPISSSTCSAISPTAPPPPPKRPPHRAHTTPTPRSTPSHHEHASLRSCPGCDMHRGVGLEHVRCVHDREGG